MKHKGFYMVLAALTWWIAMLGLIAFYEWEAAGLCLFASSAAALAVGIDGEKHTNCEGCDNHLGGGSCRINEEDDDGMQAAVLEHGEGEKENWGIAKKA